MHCFVGISCRDPFLFCFQSEEVPSRPVTMTPFELRKLFVETFPFGKLFVETFPFGKLFAEIFPFGKLFVEIFPFGNGPK